MPAHKRVILWMDDAVNIEIDIKFWPVKMTF